MDISQETWNTQDRIHISNGVQEEERTKYGYSGPFRRENKIPTGDTETKCGIETEGKTIQRLPHQVIHHILSYKTQTLISMPTNT